jgi:hypothetical protein
VTVTYNKPLTGAKLRDPGSIANRDVHQPAGCGDRAVTFTNNGADICQ